MSKRFRLDGKEIDPKTLNIECKTIVSKLEIVEEKLLELRNLLAVFTKAKKGYISDIKSEMINVKTGGLFWGEKCQL